VRCHRGPNLSTKPSRRNASDERETLFSLHQSLARCRPSASHSTSRFQRSRRQQGIRGTRTAVRPGRTTDTQGATHTAPPPRTEPKGRPAAVRAHWASNSVNRHERETAERSFAQAGEHRPLITAGQHAHRSLPGYPTNRNQRLRTERRLPSALHRYVPPRQGPTCPRPPDTPSERASFQRPDIARNARTTHNARTQSRRSGALRGRFKNRGALHMMSHRKDAMRKPDGKTCRSGITFLSRRGDREQPERQMSVASDSASC